MPSSETRQPDAVTQFNYLLNAMEAAAHHPVPAKHGYAEKRKAVYDFVRSLATPAPAAGATLTVDGFVKFVEDCRWNSFPVSLREFKQLAQAYAALSRNDGAEGKTR